MIVPSAAVARMLARGPAGERSLVWLLETAPAGIAGWLAGALDRHGQAGYAQGVLASMLVGAVLIVLGLTLGGVF